MTADPKPAKRIVNTRAGIAKCQGEGACRVCGRAWPLNRHHLVPRSQSGDDLDANIVPLCGSGTTGCHGRVEARDQATRAMLRDRLREDELGYILGKKGEAWLDRHYPARLAA